jgi:hypothetical protein
LVFAWPEAPNRSGIKNRLKAILEETKLEHLMPLFADQAVKDDIINYLDDSDLEKLGINKLGDRKRLLLAFARPSEFTVDGTVLLEVPGGNLPSDWAFAGARVPSFEIGKYPVLVEEWEWVRAWCPPHERYRLGMVLRRRIRGGCRKHINGSSPYPYFCFTCTPEKPHGLIWFRLARNV